VITSFFGKVTLAILASFVVVGTTLILFTQNLTDQYQDEVQQKLHLDLADHLAHDKHFLQGGKIDKEDLEKTFHNMMILGPSFEFYLLDKSGRILAHAAEPGKVKVDHVSVEPIREFLAHDRPLPIFGTDPRSPGHRKVFSATALDGGFLYVIIGGEKEQNIVDLVRGSHIMGLSVTILSAGLGFSLIVALLLFAFLTNPIRRLNRDILFFRAEGLESAGSAFSHWRRESPDEIQQLGVAFDELSEQLSMQYQRVKSIDQLRKELLSYISHDLRTPLSSLQGYLETWQIKQSTLTEEESQHYISIAMENAGQISAMVEQLFELAHLDSDEVSIRLEPVVIADLTPDVVQQLEIEAREQQIRLDIRPRDSSLVVFADIEKLERVLTNLIDNAIRHCSPNDTVTVRFEASPAAITIGVEDTGTGIPPDDIERIFEPHFKARNTRTGKKTNTGLGLAITKRLLELHGATIEVTSRLGEGTRFSFALARNETAGANVSLAAD